MIKYKMDNYDYFRPVSRDFPIHFQDADLSIRT